MTVNTTTPELTRREAIQAAGLCAGALLLAGTGAMAAPKQAYAASPLLTEAKEARAQIVADVKKAAKKAETTKEKTTVLANRNVVFKFENTSNNVANRFQPEMAAWNSRGNAPTGESRIEGRRYPDEFMYKIDDGDWKGNIGSGALRVKLKPGKTLTFRARTHLHLHFAPVSIGDEHMGAKDYEVATKWSGYYKYKNSSKKTITVTLRTKD